MNTFTGMVFRTDGYQVSVRTEDGAELRCVLRGKLRQERGSATSPTVIGDRVEIRVTGDAEGVVQRVLPRRTQLARRAPLGGRRDHGQDGSHVLVANLDLAVVVIPIPARPTVIDRYLDMVVAGGSRPLICLNKIDTGDLEAARSAATKYVSGGTRVVLASALRGDGVDELRSELAGKLSAFVGPSGAGKSSLLNAIEPGLALKVGGLNVAGKGAHTTSWSQIFSVAQGLVADTPGLRELEYHADEAFTAQPDIFAEITALGEDCRFRDCSHAHEPGCAVKDRLEAGKIDETVYQRFLRLAKRGKV